MIKKIIKFIMPLFIIISIFSGCDYFVINSNNTSSNNASSSNRNNIHTLELISFIAFEEDEKNEQRLKKNKIDKDSNIQEVLIEDGKNTINFETIVKNDDRLSFVDMVINISHFDIAVVFNEGNGKYICSTTTVYENNQWVTKISFSLEINFDGIFDKYGFIEIDNIYFLDTSSNKIETKLDTISVKKINYHQHYGTLIINEISPCLFENYEGYNCLYCEENIFISGRDLDPDKHEYENDKCIYCGISNMAIYEFKLIASTDEIISNAKIEIKLNEITVANIMSNEEGRASIILERKKYTAQIIESKSGLIGDIISIEEGINILKLEYGVIKEVLPDGHTYEENELIYDFVFEDINNRTYTFSDILEGKKGTIIVFIATWDAWSFLAIADLEKYYNYYNKQFEIIAFCIDGGNIEKLVSENNITYYVAHDVDNEIFNTFGLDCCPVYAFINNVGMIKKIQKGYISEATEFASIIKSTFSI